MPLRPYFAWVGSILLVALFVADWCFPAPVHAPRSEIPPHERVNLRIHFGSQMAGKSGVRHHASAIDTRRRHQSRARRRARAPESGPSMVWKGSFRIRWLVRPALHSILLDEGRG